MGNFAFCGTFRLDVLDPINIWFLHCNLQAENFRLNITQMNTQVLETCLGLCQRVQIASGS